MKRTPLLILLVFLVAAVASILWLSRSSAPAGEPSQASEAMHTPAPAPKSDAALVALESDASAPTPVSERASAASEKKAGALAWNEAESLWVQGNVRIPAGCEDDPDLRAYATLEPRDSETLLREIQTEKDRDLPDAVLSKASVDSAGNFRLPFPPGTARGAISIAGRYLYTPNSVSVELASATRATVITPKCGAWIQGDVTLPAGNTEPITKLDGLDVKIRTSMEGYSGSLTGLRGIRRSLKLKDGRFEFWAVPVESKYNVSLEPAEFAAVDVRVSELRAGRPHPLHVTLLNGGTIRGVVRGPSGAPVDGAKVEAQTKGSWFGFDNRSIRETTTGADGRFELKAVTPGKRLVQATRDGFLTKDPVTVDLADGAVTGDVVVELSDGAEVAGTAKWSDGTPAREIEVSVEFDRAHLAGMEAFNALHGGNGKAKTDDTGRFTVGGLGLGPFVVSARAAPPGDAGVAAAADTASPSDGATASDAKKKSKAWDHRGRIENVKPGTLDLALVLAPPQGVRGRVQNVDGGPIAKFRVKYAQAGRGPMGAVSMEKREEPFEDPQGAFLLGELDNGTWKIVAEAEGLASSDAVEIKVPRTDADPELVLTLVRAATVTGVVQGSLGSAVADATVRPDTGEPSWMQMMNAMASVPSAKSDAEGKFTLEGVKPGKVSLTAAADGHAKSDAVALELAPGEVRADVVILLREGGSLTGEVFREDGQPAPEMLVQVTDLTRYDSQMSFTDGRGKFAIEHLQPGNYQVVAMPAGQGEGSMSDQGSSDSDSKGMASMMSKLKMTTADIKEGEETHVILGAPPKNPVHVHGRVTHDGEPYKGALMTFVGEGKKVIETMKNTTVADDGSYSVNLGKPGHYVVSVQKLSGGMGQQNLIEFSREIPETEDHKLDFELPTARISGRVLGPGGDPASGVRISLTPQGVLETGTMWGGAYQELSTDDNGRFDIPALRPGTYSLMAGGMTMAGLFGGSDAGALGREVKGDLKLSEGEWMRDVDFRLKSACTVEVLVVDDHGAPIHGAAVFARDKDGRILDRFSMLSTDGTGRCKYHGLAPGSYSFAARKDLLASADSARVRVEDGEPVECRIALAGGTVLLVTIVDKENKAMRAGISVQDSEGREVGGMIALSEVMKIFGEGGFSMNEQRIGPLPPGKYRVKATLDGKTTTKPVTLGGQEERKLTIRLDD